jgi:hypothetical protein
MIVPVPVSAVNTTNRQVLQFFWPEIDIIIHRKIGMFNFVNLLGKYKVVILHPRWRMFTKSLAKKSKSFFSLYFKELNHTKLTLDPALAKQQPLLLFGRYIEALNRK